MKSSTVCPFDSHILWGQMWLGNLSILSPIYKQQSNHSTLSSQRGRGHWDASWRHFSYYCLPGCILGLVYHWSIIDNSWHLYNLPHNLKFYLSGRHFMSKKSLPTFIPIFCFFLASIKATLDLEKWCILDSNNEFWNYISGYFQWIAWQLNSSWGQRGVLFHLFIEKLASSLVKWDTLNGLFLLELNSALENRENSFQGTHS